MFLLLAQLCILVVLVILNIWYGIDKGLYDTIWWWDIPTHFLGGVWAGLFSLWVLQYLSKRFSILYCVVGALGIGLVWELFEWQFGVAGNSFLPYWLDTLKDLMVDMLGALAAGYAMYLQKDLWQRK